jgi:predicted phage gp36 major capsid-like protein
MDLVAGAASQMLAVQTNTEEVKRAYAIVKATLDHVAEHEKLGQTTSPYLLAIVETGTAPAPMPIPELPPAQPQGAQ